MNPFLPLGVPWQAPMLHPPTFMAATTSRRKLTGVAASIAATATGTATDLPPTVSVKTVAPLRVPRRYSPSSTRTTPGDASFASAVRVKSRTDPSANLPVTTSCRASRGPDRATALGCTVSSTGSWAERGSASAKTATRARRKDIADLEIVGRV